MESNTPSSKLFVGNLSWEVTSEDLSGAFGQYGTVVEAVVVADRESGRSRGFGFVTMSTPEEAQAALAGTQGLELGGSRPRPIRVDLAESKPREDRGPRDGGYRE